eukprot:197765_1
MTLTVNFSLITINPKKGVFEFSSQLVKIMTENEPQNIIKEGWCLKKSKHIGSWRRRWVVLTREALYTYQNEKTYINPTETIYGSSIISIGSSKLDKMFFVKQNNISFHFQADTNDIKEDWLNKIKFCMRCIKLPVIVECERNREYDCKFDLSVPYHTEYNYGIKQLIMDIIEYIQKRYSPIQFIATKIMSDSFIGQQINYNDYQWNDTKNINGFPKDSIMQRGIHLLVDIAIYEHKITSLNTICNGSVEIIDYQSNKIPIYKYKPLLHDHTDKNMNKYNLCPIYAQMRYQDKFTEG